MYSAVFIAGQKPMQPQSHATPENPALEIGLFLIVDHIVRKAELESAQGKLHKSKWLKNSRAGCQSPFVLASGFPRLRLNGQYRTESYLVYCVYNSGKVKQMTVKTVTRSWVLGGAFLTLFACLAVSAADSQPDAEGLPSDEIRTQRMDNASLGTLLKELDPGVSGRAGNWVVTFKDTSAQILTDQRADRMRIMIPIADASDLEAEVLYRMLQANYESALDARYAIAQGLVWVAYIHPLSPLTETELVLALAQTYNAAETYGSSFSGGLFQFGGGDNRSEIFDDILDRGTQL